MKPSRIMVALAVCFLLTACGKDKPPVLPKPAESAKPASVESAAAGVKLNTAEPVVPAPPLAVPPAPQALQTPQPIQARPEPPPPGASAADVQTLREAFDRQKDADKVSIEELQSRLATLAQRLAVLEAKPASQPVAHQADTPKQARKPKAHTVLARHSAAKISPIRSVLADTVPVLPFFVGSVDTWEGEKEVMVRSGGQWLGLKPGDTQDGWRIESTDGQAVTLRSPQGKLWQIQAGQGG